MCLQHFRKAKATSDALLALQKKADSGAAERAKAAGASKAGHTMQNDKGKGKGKGKGSGNSKGNGKSNSKSSSKGNANGIRAACITIPNGAGADARGYGARNHDTDMLPSIAHLSSAHVHTTGAVPFTTKGSFHWQHPSYGVEASTTSHSAGAGAGSGSMDSSGRAAPAAHAIHQFMHSTAAAQAGAIKLDADADAEVAAQTRHQAVSAMSPASGGKGSPPPTLPRGERGERGGGMRAQQDQQEHVFARAFHAGRVAVQHHVKHMPWVSPDIQSLADKVNITEAANHGMRTEASV